MKQPWLALSLSTFARFAVFDLAVKVFDHLCEMPVRDGASARVEHLNLTDLVKLRQILALAHVEAPDG